MKIGMKRNEEAVSPVIGVILMVAITVILAAVIAAFVFGMGAPEQAPQASLKSTASTDASSLNVVVIDHQGGDAVIFDSTTTKVTFDGNEVNFGDIAGDSALERFEAGETLYLSFDDDDDTYWLDDAENTSHTTAANIKASNSIGTIKIIDKPSQQMVADMEVRF